MDKKDESKGDRFRRLAEKRTNVVLKKLKVLGNCSNRQLYSYTTEEVEKIFSTIEKKFKNVKAKFNRPESEQKFVL